MNLDQTKGEWKIMKGKALKKWGELTDDELDQIEGDREQLEGLIQKRYGKSKETVKNEVDEWLKEDK